jgi:hypothetical protein
MESYSLKFKALSLYAASGLLAMSIGGVLALATAAQNLSSFDFLKYVAFISIYGILTFGTSFSIEHQTTRSLTSESACKRIGWSSLLLSPLRSAAALTILMVCIVLVLENLNDSGLYSNLYFPLGISICLTFIHSGLRGWAATLESSFYLSNSNVLAGCSVVAIPLLLINYLEGSNAYVWGYPFTYLGSILYLAFKLHRHNHQPKIISANRIPPAKIGAKLTWAYQGLALTYLGSSLLISHSHNVGEETIAAQAQMYLVCAKAVPQVLFGVISLAIAFLANKHKGSRARYTLSWALSALVASLGFNAVAFLILPNFISYLTDTPVVLSQGLVLVIFLSMIMVSMSFALIPNFIHEEKYTTLAVIWWASGAITAFGLTFVTSSGISAGIMVIFAASFTTLFASFLNLVKDRKRSIVDPR